MSWTEEHILGSCLILLATAFALYIVSRMNKYKAWGNCGCWLLIIIFCLLVLGGCAALGIHIFT